MPNSSQDGVLTQAMVCRARSTSGSVAAMPSAYPARQQNTAWHSTVPTIIERLALSPNEKLLAGLTDQQKVRLWTVEDGKPAEQQPPEGDYSAVMFVSDTVLAMGHWQGITLWDMQQNTSRELKGPQGFTYALALGKNRSEATP
ncbi:MAG: hypothetical protein HUU57_14620 [Bdellovibrio sp.]|nr:hypothetical protein [Bdellovibrio sp.]